MLGHSRLSIIDIAGGAQPMASADGRHLIAYNGEIYNFQALRRELEARGRRFATRSDTEVLLARLRSEWGRDVLPRLDGIFAFAIWDAREQRRSSPRATGSASSRCSTRRTRACRSPRPWRRSSRCRASRASSTTRRCATTSLSRPRSRRTRFLKAVRQLPPAHWLEWRDGDARAEHYWSIPPPVQTPARRSARRARCACWRNGPASSSSPMCRSAPSSPAASTAA